MSVGVQVRADENRKPLPGTPRQTLGPVSLWGLSREPVR